MSQFPDRFITKGKEGGEAAADALLAALQQYMHEMTGQANGMDVLVRAFANVSGLGQALELGGRLKNATQLREFATGFSRRQAFFDFVDVGDGKERADFKVRGKTDSYFPPPPGLYPSNYLFKESTKFFLESFQCKHLVLACGHDAGYAPFLGQFAGDQQVADRITLLEVSPFPRAIRELGLKKTQFGSVFGRIAQPAVSSALVGPLTWGRVAAVTAEAAATPLASRRNSIERPVAAAAAAASPPASPQTRRHSPQAESNRLGPVLVGEDGRRIDRRLHVNTAIVEKLRKVSLCYHLFLRGECVMPKCPRTHWVRQLTNEEFDALWWLARQGQCYTSMNGKECSDATCVYSHATKEV